MAKFSRENEDFSYHNWQLHSPLPGSLCLFLGCAHSRFSISAAAPAASPPDHPIAFAEICLIIFPEEEDVWRTLEEALVRPQ